VLSCYLCYVFGFNSNLNPFENPSRELYVLIIGYYLVDNFTIRYAIYKFCKSDPTNKISRVPQVLFGFAMASIFAYDTGARAARHQDVFEVCSSEQGNKGNFVSLQRSNDLAICARVDWEHKIVYFDFSYFKIPDNGDRRYFWNKQFKPVCIGVTPISLDGEPVVSCP